MSDVVFRTTLLHRCLDRLRDGDDSAYDELIHHTGQRLQYLASRMLHHFPAVRRWEDTSDVLQDAHMRLLRDLRDKQKRPGSVREFFSLATNRIRSALKDLHRHYQGRLGMGKHHADVECSPAGSAIRPALDPADVAPDPEELDLWSAFHEEVEKLDATQREVVGLIFYQGWTQAEVASLLGVSDTMVRKHWAKACIRLREGLGEDLPDF
jgi:RNA polymerase sigma-70 factor (ECF subfamily)